MYKRQVSAGSGVLTISIFPISDIDTAQAVMQAAAANKTAASATNFFIATPNLFNKTRKTAHSLRMHYNRYENFVLQ